MAENNVDFEAFFTDSPVQKQSSSENVDFEAFFTENAPLQTEQPSSELFLGGETIPPDDPKKRINKWNIDLSHIERPAHLSAPRAALERSKWDTAQRSRIKKEEDKRREIAILNEVLEGRNFQGVDAVGPLAGWWPRDQLKRKSFEDKKAYAERILPKGSTYFVVETFPKEYREAYSVPDPESPTRVRTYLVDPIGGKDLAGDIGDVTGSAVTAANVGALAASIFAPATIPAQAVRSGLAGGAGAIVDQVLADESDRTPLEVATDIDTLARAGRTVALEGTAAGVGQGLFNIAKGLGKGSYFEDISPEEIASSSRDLSMSEGQKAAIREGLVLPRTFQSENISAPRKLVGDFMARLSNVRGDIVTSQEESVWAALSRRATDEGIESFSDDELYKLMDLNVKKIKKGLGDQARAFDQSDIRKGLDPRKRNLPVELEDTKLELQKLFKQSQESIKKAVDDTYTGMMNEARKRGIKINISTAQAKAERIKTGTLARVQEDVLEANNLPEGLGLIDAGDGVSLIDLREGVSRGAPKLAITLENLGSDFKFELDKLLALQTDLRIIKKGEEFYNPFSGIDVIAPETVDSYKQLLEIRRNFKNIADGGGNRVREALALDIIDAIDEDLAKAFKNRPDLLNALEYVKDLWKLDKITRRNKRLAEMFSSGDDDVTTFVDAFWRGGSKGMNIDDWNQFNKWLDAVDGESAKRFKARIHKGFFQDLASQPELLAGRLKAMKEKDRAFYNALVPLESNRKALDKIAANAEVFYSDPLYKEGLKISLEELTELYGILKNRSSTQIQTEVSQTGGFNGKNARRYRAAIFDDILRDVEGFSKNELKTVNIKELNKKINDLTSFKGEFENFKPLFTYSRKKPGKNLNDKQAAAFAAREEAAEKKAKEYLRDLKQLGTYVRLVAKAGEGGGGGAGFQAHATGSALAKGKPKALAFFFQANLFSRILSRPARVHLLREIAEDEAKGKFNGATYGLLIIDVLNEMKEEIEKEDYEGQGKISIDRNLVPELDILPQSRAPQAAPTPQADQTSRASPLQTPATLPLSTGRPASQLASSSVPYQALWPYDEFGSLASAPPQRRNAGIAALG